MSYSVTANKIPKLTLGESDTAASVLQGVALILSTMQGTCPLYRSFGINRRSVDKPIDVAKPMLVIDIEEAIREFEPRAAVRNITFAIDRNDPGRLIPTVEVDIVDDKES